MARARNRRGWSAAEIGTLVDMAGNARQREIRDALQGRTWFSIKTKASRLDLPLDMEKDAVGRPPPPEAGVSRTNPGAISARSAESRTRLDELSHATLMRVGCSTAPEMAARLGLSYIDALGTLERLAVTGRALRVHGSPYITYHRRTE